MSIDHAAAHEALADLALEPGRLLRLESDADPAAAELRAHLAACVDCTTELAAWRRVYGTLTLAVGAAPGATLGELDLSEPAAVPSALRERTLRAVSSARLREEGPPAVTAPVAAASPRRAWRGWRGRSPGRLAWVAAAAALVLALGAGGLAYQRSMDLDQARAEAASLAAATATLDRILATPTHWVVTLRTADGATGGTLAWSNEDVVVLSSALPVPAAGTVYRCWIERDGTRTVVGVMDFAGGTAYWAGSAASWGDLAPGSRFGVSAVSDPATGGGPAVLVAQL